MTGDDLPGPSTCLPLIAGAIVWALIFGVILYFGLQWLDGVAVGLRAWLMGRG